MPDFKKDSTAVITGTHFHATVEASPAALIDLFGAPGNADGHKVSMEFVFVSEDGDVVTLYDWKATDLYGGTRTTRAMLRRQTKPFEFHVGAHKPETATAFLTWLKKQGVA